ncbi:MAG: NAD(P)/FAD-dependent oxidoreductase [Candidatus Heimdallarchaeum aukensis]|uniref:NAD(P)/FAD-dependent oxidoreductase n=1 Tax=Candidatus Heimdallarchaeum aukensis TaxID=2876573 RepID=A0A9Y1BL67_9ARCH|nr:MAG: NAD(P)/FAD-dependent oxidoreductase [Candidatus Heimdallarchaeum aukensis]
MNSSFDVIIIGAGPAGLILAYSLGKNRLKALLIEQKPMELIGEKTCGDALGFDRTEELKDLIQIEEPNPEVICAILETAHLSSENKFEISIPFQCRTINRLKYGQQLLKNIQQFSTVSILTETKVVEPIITNDKLEGVVIRNKEGKKSKFYAKIIVDCSGYTAIIRKQLPSNLFPKINQVGREETIVSCREIIQTKEEHSFQKQMRIELHPELPPPGYFWIFSKGKKKLNIGVGWLINEQNKKIKPSVILEKIRKKIFPECTVIKHDTDLLPGRLPLYSMVGDNFIVCGDAAALANPINGEGHGPALISGYYAASTIISALEREDFSERSLWKYNVEIWKKFGYLGSMGIAIHKFLKKYPISDFEYLFTNGIITQEDVNNILYDLGYKPSIFNKFIKAMKRPKLMLRLVRMILIARKIEKLCLSYPTEEKDFNKWKRKMVKLELREL